jgi:hypothetical protein
MVVRVAEAFAGRASLLVLAAEYGRKAMTVGPRSTMRRAAAWRILIARPRLQTIAA